MTGIAAAARLPACAAQLHLGERACSNKDVSKRQERSTARKGESFEKFLESPMAKLALSMIPSTNPPEVLRQLLELAYRTRAARAHPDVGGSAEEMAAANGAMNRFCRDCRNIIVPGHSGGNLTWARCAVAPERDPVSGEMRNAFAAETRGPGGKCGPDGALFEPKAKAV